MKTRIKLLLLFLGITLLCSCRTLVQKGVEKGFDYAKQSGVFNKKVYVINTSKSDTLLHVDTTLFKATFKRLSPGVYLLEFQLKFENSRKKVKELIKQLEKLQGDLNNKKMTLVKKVYLTVIDQLKQDLSPDAIKYYSLYNSQNRYGADERIIPTTPYLLVQPMQANFRYEAGLRLSSPLVLRLHLGTSAYADAQDGSVNQEEALRVFELITSVEQVVEKIDSDCIGGIEVISTQYDADYHSNLREDVITIHVYPNCQECS